MSNLSRRNPWDTIRSDYEVLKQHEDYWMMDNDYCRKYEYVREAATENAAYASGTAEYIAANAEFLMEAHRRIFERAHAV